MRRNPGLNCLDIVEPFTKGLEVHAPDSNVLLLGGIGSAALTLEGTEIFPEERLVVAPETKELQGKVTQFREKGTKRDLDMLVTTTDKKEVDFVESIAEDMIGDELVLSFFGLKTREALQEQKRHPFRSLGMVWVADRYMLPDGKSFTKSLFPFEVEVPMETLEPWSLVVGDRAPLPIPSPAVTPLNYMTRSLSGIRPKDASKFEEMVRTIEKKAPELIDWMIDGPGASHIQLARAFHSLREPKVGSRPLKLGEHIFYTMQDDEIMDGDVLTQDLPDNMRRFLLNASRAKGRTVYKYESNDRLVALWQENVEPRIDKIIKNN